MTYHWKGVEKGYNFVVGSTSIIIVLKYIYHTKFQTNLFLKHMVGLGNNHLPWKETSLNYPKE